MATGSGPFGSSPFVIGPIIPAPKPGQKPTDPLNQYAQGVATMPQQVAGGLIGDAIGTVVPAVVRYVFSTFGDFLSGFGSTLLHELGKVNHAYIIGLLVAAVVVFVLLGG